MRRGRSPPGSIRAPADVRYASFWPDPLTASVYLRTLSIRTCVLFGPHPVRCPGEGRPTVEGPDASGAGDGGIDADPIAAAWLAALAPGDRATGHARVLAGEQAIAKTGQAFHRLALGDAGGVGI